MTGVTESTAIEGHGGHLALAALRAFGVTELFTLSGGHVFPLYDAAHHGDVRIVDVRHEQSAVFAAEAVAKLQRRPGLAVLTAGPGVTNGISGLTSAYFNGAPVIVVGGRAPQFRWGAGSLQEIDHVPLVASITKNAATVDRHRGRAPAPCTQAAVTALTPHRGPGLHRPAARRGVQLRRGEAAGGHRRTGHRARPGRRVPGRGAAVRRRASRHHRGIRRLRGRRRRGPARGRGGAARTCLHQRHGPGQPPAIACARLHQGPPGGAARAPTSSPSSAPRWTSGSVSATSARRRSSTSSTPPSSAPNT